jgi:hypothetical protein
LVGTLGGQNTAFSIAILSLGAAMLEKTMRDRSSSSGILAGLIFSCWLLKPQFGLLLVPGFIFFRLWQPLLGFMLGAACQYLVGVILIGPFWPLNWARKIMEFSALNYDINSINQASIIGTINVVLSRQFDTRLFSILAITLLTLSYLFILTRGKKYRTQENFMPAFWAFLAAIPLIAPQTLFYDVGIIFFALLNCLRGSIALRTESSILTTLTAAQVIACLTHQYREDLPIPLFFLIATFYCSLALAIALKQLYHKKRLL